MSPARRILVTGGSGFVGQALLPALRRAYPEAEILATGSGDLGIATIRSAPLDLTNADSVDRVVGEFAPTDVVHLAALSSVQGAFGSPRAVWDVNVTGVLRLVDALRRTSPDACFIFASSAEAYGRSFAGGDALDESAPLAPENPYARSKAAAEYALRDLWADRGRLVILRMFNHLGPGQDERFVAAAFAAQVARAEQGLGPRTINVGDLSAERDFGDVRDLLRAYVAVLDKAQTFETQTTFNVCSGVTRPVRAIAEGLAELATVDVDFVVEAARVRPQNIPRAAGSNAALTAATGWKPQERFEDTIQTVLDYWRAKTA